MCGAAELSRVHATTRCGCHEALAGFVEDALCTSLKQQARFSDTCVTDDDVFEQVGVRHFVLAQLHAYE